MCLPGWVQGVSLPICLSFTRFTVGLEVAARALIPGNKPLRTVTFLAKRSRKGALLTVLARMRGLGGPERAFSSRFTVGFHLFPHELLLFLTVLTRNDGKRRPRVGVLRTSGMSECCKCALFLLLFWQFWAKCALFAPWAAWVPTTRFTVGHCGKGGLNPEISPVSLLGCPWGYGRLMLLFWQKDENVDVS